ncbi:MAG: inosine/xanthosine triphosphatase [Oscillospiraceae bacterium]|nr:inosine/xanthosine triphosphatase [Oscillospiraceae bacterium]
MLVSIGSRSIPKIIAITRGFSKYPELWMDNEESLEFVIMPKEERKDECQGQEKDKFSGVSCNPLTLGETINGAKTRAKNAFEYAKESNRTCTYGVGIEAGMYPVPEVDTKFMDTSICAIYDGEKYYIGFSPSFEYPQTVVDRVLEGEELGFMEDIFGSTAKGRKGAIGVLTAGRVYRDELEEYAVIMALTKIAAKEVYDK